MRIIKKPFRRKGRLNNTFRKKSRGLPKGLEQKLQIINPYTEKNKDIIVRILTLQPYQDLDVAVVYIEGLIDSTLLHQDILRPLTISCKNETGTKVSSNKLMDYIYKSSLSVGQITTINSSSELIQTVFDGFVIIMVDGFSEVFTIDIRGGESRAIDEPPGERTLRGSREGFVETLTVNIALIRRILRDPKLIVEKTIVGRRTRTDVALLYVEDIADPQIISKLRSKLDQINIDSIESTGQIEQLIEDNPYSIFPQIRSTQRSDRLVAALLEGRVAIMANGTPWVMMVPSLFAEFLQGSEDYYDRVIVGSFNRFFRFLAFFITISLPGLYISALSFQPELIPFKLIVPLAEARKQVPFPVVAEVFLQEIIVQLIIESGLRMPTTIAQTVGVVGGIVLGQAAVAAKLVSPGLIIVIAVTILANFSIPTYSMLLAVRVLRIGMIILCCFFGIFGFSLGWLLILTILADLESFGTPYFAPFSPTRYRDLKDSVVRTFTWKLNNRPDSIPLRNRRRQKT